MREKVSDRSSKVDLIPDDKKPTSNRNEVIGRSWADVASEVFTWGRSSGYGYVIVLLGFVCVMTWILLGGMNSEDQRKIVERLMDGKLLAFSGWICFSVILAIVLRLIPYRERKMKESLSWIVSRVSVMEARTNSHDERRTSH